MMNTSNDKSKQYERQNSTTKTERIPSWQIARDISTAILWRQSTRLSSKQGRYESKYIDQSSKSCLNVEITYSSTKEQVHPGTKSNQSQVYRTPRMPTEREAALVIHTCFQTIQ